MRAGIKTTGAGLLACLTFVPASAQDEIQIRFVTPRHLATVLGSSPIELELTMPAGAEVERLELLVDGKPLTTLTAPPWKAKWDFGNAGRGHGIAAVVYLTDGSESRAAIRTSALRVDQFEGVGLVNLYALVHDKSGKYVPDLSKQDFRVLENGKPQVIRRFTTERKPLRVGIVLDVSASMKGRRIERARSAALEFLDVLEPGDEGMVVTFCDGPYVAQGITSGRNALAAAIQATTARGGTALYDGVYRSAKELQGFDGRRVMVLLSDGRDEAVNGLEPGSLHTLDEALIQALHSEVMIFVIGLGNDLDEELDFYRRRTVGSILRRFADETGGKALLGTSSGELRKAFKSVADDLRNQYLLAYVSADNTRDGKWREIQVLTPGRKLEVLTRKGYYATNGRSAGVR